MRFIWTVIVGGILFSFAKGQWQSVGDVKSFEKTDEGIILDATPAKVKISICSSNIVRVRMTPSGAFLRDSSWAVVNRNPGSRQHVVSESAGRIILAMSGLTVEILRSPLRISFRDSAGALLNQDEPKKGMAWAGSEVAVWKVMPSNEEYYGFGEKAGTLKRKWKSMSMWNSDIPGYKADTDPLYETIPFFYGIRDGKAYGIFFDNTYYSWFNMGKEDPGQYSFGASGGELDYYFIFGPRPAEVAEQFSSLIGRMPLPPRWAIAYQQCRYSYYPESRVREIAATFRQKQIPCDVIYLDIHYMDEYRCFTWDKSRFPNPKKMIDDLAKDGFKMVVIIDPGIKNEPGYWVYDQGIKGDDFVKYPDGKPFVGKVWPGECVFPDFTRKETREWWGTLYRGLIDSGIKGFWNDMNEPAVFDVPTKTFDLNVIHDDMGLKSDHRKIHNVYGMQMARGTYEGVAALRPNERPFVLTRANYAGGNRYAAAWTGDNVSSWEHLELAIPMCLNLSISGQPFVGTDIGGFIGNPSGELYTRWLQLGVFTPLMRTHTEIGSADQEPWSYGSKFEEINRKSIELRYKLLPYIYTQFYRSSVTGVPIMRPVFFDYPHHTWIEWEFLFGDAFLVSPVVKQFEKQHDIFLPEGEWYDYWTHEKITGGRFFRIDVPLEKIPLYVKAGSIIPTQQVMQYSDQGPIDPLMLEIFPSTFSSAQVYEDDGISFDFKKGKYCLRNVTVTTREKNIEVKLLKPEGSFRPRPRSIVLKVADIPRRPASVGVLGKGVKDRALSEGKAWSYDSQSRTLEIKFEDSFEEQTVIVRN